MPSVLDSPGMLPLICLSHDNCTDVNAGSNLLIIQIAFHFTAALLCAGFLEH